MSIISDVIEWVKTLPPWQGDAVRRLLLAGEHPIDGEEFSEIVSLAKADLKLEPPPKDLQPIPLSTCHLSGSSTGTDTVKLISIKDVSNVNIIASDQTQLFSENGVTIIYGDNGSGKSGYSRILKLACQARDKDDFILPNVFLSEPIEPASATLEVKVNDIEESIIWTQGVASTPILTNINVFDSRCARVITDKQNEIIYLPYGGDIFQKLVEIILRVRSVLESESIKLEPIEDSGVTAGTPSEAFIKSLSDKTKEDIIEAQTQWTQKDEIALRRHEELLRLSDSTKITKEIALIVKNIKRINDTINSITHLDALCSQLTNKIIETTIEELAASEKAYEIAVAEKQTPEPLIGVASTSQWEILYKAAKEYSEKVAYPGVPFPNIGDAVCVLCQQSLSEEAIERFARFKSFMEDKTCSVLEAKRASLKSLHKNVKELEPLIGLALESICDEISNYDQDAGDALRAYHSVLTERKNAILAILDEGAQVEHVADLPNWPESIEAQLRAVEKILTSKKIEIEAAAKPEEHQLLAGKVATLKSRKALSQRKENIGKYVNKAKRNAGLNDAITSLRTQEITRKGTNIIRENLTPELLSSFQAELKSMRATQVPISVKPIGRSGETVHEMMLEGATKLGRTQISQVLSEGETRVIAIAGFLAELQIAPHSNPIVLDDPVSSLDHVYTERIARRLIKEGIKRQVILFTHNIGFLMELQDAAEELAKTGAPINVAVHTLRRDGNSAGITTNGVPWHTMKVKQRVHYLDEYVHKIKPLYVNNQIEYNEQAARVYGFLREAWEACIEDDLFSSVVCRYRNSIQTLKLTEVDIEDPDIHHIDLNMTKASTWMTGHDKSKALHSDRPEPEEILCDIDALREFCKKINSRRGKTKNRRKGQLKPS